MTDTSITQKSSSTLGEKAVDGLLTGIAAGFVMAVYLTIATLMLNKDLTTMALRFAPDPQGTLIGAVLLHFATAGIYGMVFGVLYRLIERLTNSRVQWLAGLLYGFLLWVLAHTIYLPGTGSPLQEIPAPHFLIAHLVYGLVLGGVLYWRADR